MFRRFFLLLRRSAGFAVLAAGLFILLVYAIYLHRRPATQNAFVTVNSRAVTAWVPGYIAAIHVINNQPVKKGDPLLTIDPRDYELKRERAKHALAQARAAESRARAMLASGRAALQRSRAKAANAQYLSAQAGAMVQSLAVSQAYAEERTRSAEAAAAQSAGAAHDVEALQHALAEAQAAVRKADAELALAELYCRWTVVRAQCDGRVVNMYLSPGAFAAAGSPLFAILDTSEWFIQANFKETELSTLQTGQKAEIRLWQYPGKIFHGTVLETGWGVERRKVASFSALPQVEKENEWFLLPQRFPVLLRLDDPDDAHPPHVGGSAFVTIDTPAHPVRQFFWQLFQL